MSNYREIKEQEKDDVKIPIDLASGWLLETMSLQTSGWDGKGRRAGGQSG